MMHVFRTPRAERDVRDVLRYTKEHWGEAQARRYAHFIEEAELVVAKNPKRGRLFNRRRPGIFAYHLKNLHKPARHVLFYRVLSTGTVKILRLLHDAMDVDQHLELFIHVSRL